MHRKRIFISGRVQGVYFRVYTRKAALGFGLRGWVKNLPDGRVEAVIEGEERKVEEMLEWCWQGSPSSKVEKVEVITEPYRGEFKDFIVSG
jgi:acylphosphatase